MNRAFTNILTQEVEATARFYEVLLGLNRHFASDWFVILTHETMPGFELGILDREANILPAELERNAGGVMLTFVVDDCDAVHERAVGMAVRVDEAPTDMPYGQRRMLLRDPEGNGLDVSAPTVGAN